MNYKVSLSMEVEANNKFIACKTFLKFLKNVKIEQLTCKPICPHGHEENHKSGSCWEHCGYRENGICCLDEEK